MWINEHQLIKLQAFLQDTLCKPSAYVIAVCVIGILICIIKGKKGNIQKNLRCELAFYLVILFCLLLFNREFGSVREIRWKPDPWFVGDGRVHETNILISLLDVFYFLPLGWLLHRNIKKTAICIGVSLLLAVLFEGLQFAFAAGVASLGDVLWYFVGALLSIMGVHLKYGCGRK